MNNYDKPLKDPMDDTNKQKILALLDSAQSKVFREWVRANFANMITFVEDKNIVRVMARGHYCGAYFGPISISFVKIAGLEEEYEAERAKDFFAFVKEKAGGVKEGGDKE